jgi:hypothetical protein
MPTNVLSIAEWEHDRLWLPAAVSAPLPLGQSSAESCSALSLTGGSDFGWRTVEVVLDLTQPRSGLTIEILFEALDSSCGDSRITSSVLIDDVSVEAVDGPRPCPYWENGETTTTCTAGSPVTPSVLYYPPAGSQEPDCGYCYPEDVLVLAGWTARSIFVGLDTIATLADRGSDLDTRYVDARVEPLPNGSQCQERVCTWLTYPNGLVAAADTCEADLDGDGIVGGSDLGVLLTYWGFQGGVPADLNGDGVVDGADYGLLLSAWGPCCH